MMASPEYKTLSKCYDDLLSTLQLSPGDIACCSAMRQIIPPGVLDYVKNPYHDDSDKAQRLLDSVLKQVKIHSQYYHLFTSALEAAGTWTEFTVAKLKSAYSKLIGASPVPFEGQCNDVFLCISFDSKLSFHIYFSIQRRLVMQLIQVYGGMCIYGGKPKTEAENS